ncbi:MAG: hypothetical protein QM528_07065 [Phycisphaerales bacterium]|nr:hypothetical protein [Phycisphaerales bacterium]
MKQKSMSLGSTLTRTEVKNINGSSAKLCHNRIDGLYNKCITGLCYSRGAGVCDQSTAYVCYSTLFTYCCCDSAYNSCSRDSDCPIHG